MCTANKLNKEQRGEYGCVEPLEQNSAEQTQKKKKLSGCE